MEDEEPTRPDTDPDAGGDEPGTAPRESRLDGTNTVATRRNEQQPDRDEDTVAGAQVPGADTGAGHHDRHGGDDESVGTDTPPPDGGGGPPVTGPVDTPDGRAGQVAVLVAVVGLFAIAVATGRGLTALASATVDVGGPGTLSRLLVSVTTLQVVGFGAALALVVRYHERPRSYLRVRSVDWWTVFYGTFVGMVLMILTSIATVLFQVLGLSSPSVTVGPAPEPLFYVALLVVSTLVAVPMEEVFFRGILQRSLTAAWHPVVAIGVTSALYVGIHTTVLVGTGGEALLAAMFLGFGVALGVGYHLTSNLLVPVIGHVLFNGVQILTEATDVVL
jgi:Predicted metal-dependent membrane protease